MSVTPVAHASLGPSDGTFPKISLRTHIKYQPVLEGVLGIAASGDGEPPPDDAASPRVRTGSGARLDELNADEQRQVDDLKRRDAEVRQHEQAHLAAAGPYARSGPQYEYVTGPDGKRYAVGGEVRVDTSPIPDDPAATIRKARVVRNAALAPAGPSAQDRAVAAAAQQMEARAMQELAAQRAAEAAGEPGKARLLLGTVTPFATLTALPLQTPQSDSVSLKCPHCAGHIYGHTPRP